MKADRTSKRGNQLVSMRSAVRLGLVALLALYVVAQPKLNEHFGWNLPGLSSDDAGTSASRETLPQTRGPAAETGLGSSADQRRAPGPSGANQADRSAIPRPDNGVRNNDFVGGTGVSTGTVKAGPDRARGESLRYGLLKNIGGDRYASPAGLTYGPGSAEGHRLEHLKRHTRDQPSRPGKHGVFDGGMEGALSSVDLAYRFAKERRNSRREDDRNRTIYTVDVERRVGYVGGRDGKSKGNPEARRVKLVLEGTNVITAYPL